jgi:hypothetical protein
MELIDRYAAEVGRRLPRKNRADIQDELRSNLVDTLEARAGSSPTLDDQVSLLREFGPPGKVAASYRGDRVLIGADLFPFFRMVLGIVLSVLAIVQLVLLGVLVVFSPGYTFQPTWLLEFGGSLVFAFGSVVLVFAILQYYGVRPAVDEEEETWDPRSLPEPEHEPAIQPGWLVAEMTFGLILVVLLLFLPSIQGLVAAGGATFVVNPVLQDNLPLVITSLLLGIGLDIFLLWKGQWTTATRVAKIAVNVIEVAVLAFLVAEHSRWLAAYDAQGLFSIFETIPAAAPMPPDVAQALVVWAFRLGFFVALVVLIVETVQLVISLVRRTLFSEPSRASSSGRESTPNP